MNTGKNQSLISEDDSTFVESESTENRSWTQRTFGAVGAGSMRVAIFSMMASAMGTGIFNLPLRVVEIGLLPYIIYELAAAFFAFSGATMLAQMIKKKGYSSYSGMCEEAYGAFLKRLSQFCLIVYPWGIAICFQVILTKFIIELLVTIFGFDFYTDQQTEEYNTTGQIVRVCLNVFVIVTNFALILQKKMDLLQKLSFICVAAVAFNALTIFVLFLTGFTRDGTIDYSGLFGINWSQVHWINLSSGEDCSLHAQALASILFCYVNHQLVFLISNSLKNPSQRRLNKTFRRVNVIEMSVYLMIGASGYLLLVEHEDKYPIGAMVITSITVLPMTIGKVLMVFALYFSIPLNLFPSRQIVYEAFSLQKNNKNHWILSLVLGLSSCLIAIIFQNVNSYFGLLGGTAGVMMAGGIPALAYFKLVVQTSPYTQGKHYAWLLFCLLITLIAFAGAVLSVADSS